MIYNSDSILAMGEVDFTKCFLKKKVNLVLKDRIINNVFIEQVELATNANINSNEHLPVKIRIKDLALGIFQIKQIEVIE